jgi:hypothetical protein
MAHVLAKLTGVDVSTVKRKLDTDGPGFAEQGMRLEHSTNSKDYEFSRTIVRQFWEAGLEDVRRTCAHPNGSKRRKS